MNNTFGNRLSSESKRVLIYENAELQKKARLCVPLETLSTQAQEHCANNSSIDLKDAVLIELIHWFKNDFFKWFNAPVCIHCNQDMINNGAANPSPDDLKHGAQRVELYKCRLCHSVERFPRYNDPEKLLTTRTGRCGEWANVFTLICRSLGYDSRYVMDWSDHVWTEVYSEKQKKWLHCDACEAAIDKPLLYVAGWGKKLNYVIAFSKDEVQDVTWRYTTNHLEVFTTKSIPNR